MRTDEFNKIVDEMCERVKDTLCVKQEEYNMNEDRLEFFKKASVLAGNKPHQVLMGYTNKQIVSEFEMAAADKNFTKERWLEKITDIVCYQYLLLAVLEDTDEFKKE